MAKKDDSGGIMWLAIGAGVLYLLSRRAAAPGASTTMPGTASIQAEPGVGGRIRTTPPIFLGPPLQASLYKEGDTIQLGPGETPPIPGNSALYWARQVVGNNPESGYSNWTLTAWTNKGGGIDPRDVY